MKSKCIPRERKKKKITHRMYTIKTGKTEYTIKIFESLCKKNFNIDQLKIIFPTLSYPKQIIDLQKILNLYSLYEYNFNNEQNFEILKNFNISFYISKLSKYSLIKSNKKGDLSISNHNIQILNKFTYWLKSGGENPTSPSCIILQQLGDMFKIYQISYNFFEDIFKIGKEVNDKIASLSKNKYRESLPCSRPKEDTSREIKKSFCSSCVEKHLICPCVEFPTKFPLQQRPIYSQEKKTPVLTSIKMLGWGCESLYTILRIAANVSLAFWDVESLTSCSKNIKSHGILNFKKYDCVINEGMIGQQNLYLISYGDYITDSALELITQYNLNEKNETEKDLIRTKLLSLYDPNKIFKDKELGVKIFELGNNSEASYENCTESEFMSRKLLVLKFISHIHQRMKIAQKIKIIILKPLLKCLHDIYNFHEQLTGGGGGGSKYYDNFIWTANFSKKKFHTVHTKLISGIKFFLKDFIVSAYNASSYDIPIICPLILNLVLDRINKKTYIYGEDHAWFPNTFKKIGINKRGSQINLLSINFCPQYRCIFHDYLKMESAKMSLSKFVQMYCGDKIQKGLFPHTLATSVRVLKKTKQLPNVNNAKAWTSILTGGKPSDQEIKQAYKEFKKCEANNLYEYSRFYCMNDISCFRMAVYNSRIHEWNTEGVDFILYNKFTLPSLSSYLAMVIDPLNKIEHIAPFSYCNPEIDYYVNHGIIGGVTICASRGQCGNDTSINSHLKMNDVSNDIDEHTWPGLSQLKRGEKKTRGSGDNPLIKIPFKAKGIECLDIRNLYGAAMLKEIPCGEYVLWHPQNCNSNNNEKYFSKQTGTKKFLYSEEFFITRWYLHSQLPTSEDILAVRSDSHVGGQIKFHNNATSDLYIVTQSKTFDGYKNRNKMNNKRVDRRTISFVQYDGLWFHYNNIHNSSCPKFVADHIYQNNPLCYERHNELKSYVECVFTQNPFPNEVCISVNYCILNSCDIGLCTQGVSFKNNIIQKYPKYAPSILNKKSTVSHNDLKSFILTEQVTGFLVVKDLCIEPSQRNPSFGFAVQKNSIITNNLSNEDRDKYSEIANKLNNRQSVLCLHEYRGYHAMTSQYLSFLNKNFKINVNTFSICHFIEVKFDSFLKPFIGRLLFKRDKLKKKIKLEKNKLKQNSLNIRCHKCKGNINTTYGCLLCRSENFSSVVFKTEQFLNSKKRMTTFLNLLKRKGQHINKIFPVGIVFRKGMFYGISITSQASVFNIRTLGCAVLWHSKILFFSCLNFLLKHLSVEYSEFQYCDTDSIHLLLHYPRLIDNVIPELKDSFEKNAHKYLADWCVDDPYGKLETEGFFTNIIYRCEKVYSKQQAWESTHENYVKGIQKHNVSVDLYKTNEPINVHSIKLKPGGSTGGIILQSQLHNYTYLCLKRYFTGSKSITFPKYDVTHPS